MKKVSIFEILNQLTTAEEIVDELLNATADLDNATFLAMMFTAIEGRFNYEYDLIPDFMPFIESIDEKGIDRLGKYENKNTN